MMDPEFFFDNENEADTEPFFDVASDHEEFIDEEEYIYDTYDCIFDNPESEFNHLDSLREEFGESNDHSDSSMFIGSALAFADLMKDKERYEVNKNTDKDNWKKVMLMSSIGSYTEAGSRLQPFEQYVKDYIGRGFKHTDR